MTRFSRATVRPRPAAFEGAGAEVFTFVFKSGEESKSFATYEELTEFMCRCRLSRSDIAAALGGGSRAT